MSLTALFWGLTGAHPVNQIPAQPQPAVPFPAEQFPVLCSATEHSVQDTELVL